MDDLVFEDNLPSHFQLGPSIESGLAQKVEWDFCVLNNLKLEEGLNQFLQQKFFFLMLKGVKEQRVAPSKHGGEVH